MELLVESLRGEWEALVRLVPRLFLAAIVLAAFVLAGRVLARTTTRLLRRDRPISFQLSSSRRRSSRCPAVRVTGR